jgi:hypothetical protein
MAKKFNYKKDTNKGTYKPLNPGKYTGSKYPNYKSGWEAKMFQFMDINPNVIQWGYENISIPYFDPFTKKGANYLPDVTATMKCGDGKTRAFMIEVKPYSMCIPPKPPKKPSTTSKKTYYNYQKSMSRYKVASRDYAVNIAKWGAASAYCTRHHIHWIIANEKNLPGFIK